MGSKLAFWGFLLHLLLLVLYTEQDEARYMTRKMLNDEDTVIRMTVDGKKDGKTHVKHDNDGDQSKVNTHHHTHPSSHMDHIDPSVMVFFTLKDLQIGKTMAIHFPKRDLKNGPPLLQKEKADSIPFSSKQLKSILQYFSFSQDSPQAKAIEDTLIGCEMNPIKREAKFCATSLESMLEFVRSIFGFDSHFRVVATAHLTNSTTVFQNYTIMEAPKEIEAPKMVACHSRPYAYAVFYCHAQETENRVFKVLLRGENNEMVDALAVCHLDTSQWSRNHASFRVLGIEPGTDPVCHFFPADNFVWVPIST